MKVDESGYRPRHGQPDDEPAEIRIAQQIAAYPRGRPLDTIAAELHRRLTDAGLKPVRAEFMRLANAIADGTINHAQ